MSQQTPNYARHPLVGKRVCLDSYSGDKPQLVFGRIISAHNNGTIVVEIWWHEYVRQISWLTTWLESIED